jgi:hypothetical protein
MAKNYCRKNSPSLVNSPPEPPDHRIVPPDRVAGLRLVYDEEQQPQEHRAPKDQDKDQRQNLQRVHHVPHDRTPVDLAQGKVCHAR